MAIYYIDPHTTVNGTGTFASPWSLSSTTRTGLASGDEIRIKGVALTSLLTATTYTATLTNNYQMTVTAGGGLGADFVAGDIVYFPAYDTFAKIISSTTNVLALYATYACWPVPNSTVFGTSITIRKVDRTTYPHSTTAGTYYGIGSGSTLNNITISDCWIDATTRVTDGTVKTLFNSTYTVTGMAFAPGGNTGTTSGNNADLTNTHIMPSSSTSTAATVSLQCYSSNSTVNIKQIFSTYVTGGGINIGLTTGTVQNTTITIVDCCCTGYFFNTIYAKDSTVNITNAYVYAADNIFTSGCFIGSNNLTINLNYILAVTNSYNSTSLFYYGASYHAGYNTINYNGMCDIITTAGLTYLVYGTAGRIVFNFDPVNFSIKYNKRVTTQSTLSYGYYGTAGAGGDVYFVPEINISSISFSVAKYYYTYAILTANATSKVNRVPFVYNFDAPTTGNGLPSGLSYGTNVLVTYRDGTNPVEILSIFGSGYSVSSASTNWPNLSLDATVYRTTGPSLKSYLATRQVAYWQAGNGGGSIYKSSRATKAIKIPVTSGVSVTVSGYIRTDDATYTNGDCDMAIIFLETEVATQAMTTSCINAWEQFSLTFTPSQTGEAYLVWEMYYANGAKSYWLDDLVIS